MQTDNLDVRLVSLEEDRRATMLHRWELMRLDADARIEVGLKAEFESPERPGMVKLRLTAIYTAMRAGLRRPLLTLSMTAVFEVSEPDGKAAPVLTTDSAVYLPDSVLGMMLSVSVGALRGMLAVRTVSTPLASNPLPVLSVAGLLRSLKAA